MGVVIDNVILPPGKRVLPVHEPWEDFGLEVFPPPMRVTPTRMRIDMQELVAGEWVTLHRLAAGAFVQLFETDADGEITGSMELWAC